MWIEKYRPKSLDEFVFQDDVMELHIRNMLEKGEIPHLLFTGSPGTGKTSCAFLMTRLLEIDPIDTLLINASKENNIATVREKITNFCAVAPLNSPFKVAILEEADHLTPEAQAAMRRLMEEQYRTVRFILTCNESHKIKDAINSRLQQYVFKRLTLEQVLGRVVSVLEQEGVTAEADDVLRVIESKNGDLRAILGELEKSNVNGQLVLSKNIGASGEILEQVGEMIKKDQWDAMRALVGTTVGDDDIPDLYRLLYNCLHTSPSFGNYSAKWEQGIVTIAEYLYRSASVADQFINFTALLIELKRTANGT